MLVNAKALNNSVNRCLENKYFWWFIVWHCSLFLHFCWCNLLKRCFDQNESPVPKERKIEYKIFGEWIEVKIENENGRRMTQPFANWFWFWQVFLPTLIPECGAISMNKKKRKKSQFDQKQRKNERLKIGYNNTTRAQKEEAKKQGKSVKFVQEKCKRCFCWVKLTPIFFPDVDSVL